MSNRVNDDLCLRNLVENEKRIRRCRKTANGWIIRADADIGMSHQKADDALNSSVSTLGGAG
jgi:hypothetical protein